MRRFQISVATFLCFATWIGAGPARAAGRDGNTAHAPGFPKDWKVRYEGLQPMP
ncbi:MAG: hypothetical protein ABSG67_03980 [Thermoguttaceae bacterium]